MSTTYNYLGQAAITEIATLVKARITSALGETSDNNHMAGAKAVYDAVTAAVAEVEAKIPAIATTVDAASTNDKAAGAKAVHDAITGAIADLTLVSFSKVDALPETGESNVIYLVPASRTDTQNIYEEYVWIDTAWELMGTTAIDLSGYVQASEMHELTAAEVDTVFNTAWAV